MILAAFLIIATFAALNTTLANTYLYEPVPITAVRYWEPGTVCALPEIPMYPDTQPAPERTRWGWSEPDLWIFPGGDCPVVVGRKEAGSSAWPASYRDGVVTCAVWGNPAPEQFARCSHGAFVAEYAGVDTTKAAVFGGTGPNSEVQ